MKKLFCLVILTFIAISCTDNDDTLPKEEATPVATIDPTKLAKVIFNPGATNEKHWNFYTNGLLKEITKPDGTVIQNFIYDTNNKLISSKIFNPSGINQLFTFTYDANNFVTSPEIQYNSSLDSYIIGDVNFYHSIYKLNSEKLLTDYTTVFVEYVDGIAYPEARTEQSVTYLNNNIVSSSSDGGLGCSYYTYDNKINPLRNATLAICRAFSTVHFSDNIWINGLYNSNNNVISRNYCSEDPENEVYKYEYNSNNLPVKNILNWYYTKVLEITSVFALYYYQGDVIPK